MRLSFLSPSRLDPRHSFRNRLGATIAISILMFSVLMSAIAGDIARTQAEADRGELLAHLADQLANALDRDMYVYYHQIQALASLEEIRTPLRSVTEKRISLEALQRAYKDFAWIGLTDVAGTVMASTQGVLEGSDVSERPWFVEGRTHPNVQNVHLAKLLVDLVPNPDPTHEPLRLVDMAAPVTTQSGQLIGVLGGHLYWQWATVLRDSLLTPLHDTRHVDIQIVSHEGEVLLSAGPRPVFADAEQGLSQLQSFQAAVTGETSYLAEVWPNQTFYVTGYAPTHGYINYPGLGWIVLVRQSAQTAFAAAKAVQRTILVWGALLGVVGGAISWWLAGQIIKPVIVIADAADQIRQGNINLPLPVFSGRDEIALLSRAIAHLVTNLHQQKDLLVQFNTDLEDQVSARTAKLNRLNQRLHQEIEVRNQAEQALHSANQELQRLTLIDGLTGIANRRHFDQYLEQEWCRAVRERLPLSLILLDVDYFKCYNDHFGHQKGDVCLRQIAQTARQTTHRATDLAARYGGEEFAVILPNTDRDGALYLAESLRAAVKALHLPHPKSTVTPWVTISLGVATCYPSAKLNPINLLTTVDGLLYQAKQQGRDRVQSNL